MQRSRQSARNTRSEPPLAQRDLLTRLVRARPLFLAAAFFLLGDLVEFAPTQQLFNSPADQRTADYVSGRFG